MSRTKYVDYMDQGFYVYDVTLGIFLKHLIDVAEACNQAKAPWLLALVSSWRVAACAQDIGLTLNEDEDWTTAQRQRFVAIAEEVYSTRGAGRQSKRKCLHGIAAVQLMLMPSAQRL